MNKKAIAENITLWIPRMIFLAIVVVTIVFFTRFVIAIYSETADAEANVYMNKILYEKNGIIRNASGRPYPGVIDLTRFSELYLNKSMKLEGDEGPCAKLTLVKIETGDVQTIYWHKRWYERLRPRAAFRGIGSPLSKEQQILVSIYDNGRYIPAMLNIDMVVPRK
jgi:hypothetical protein